MNKEIVISLEKFDSAKKYWLQKFSGEPESLKLLPDYPVTGKINPANIKNVRVLLQQEETRKILAAAKHNNLSLYIILLSAYKILLYKYTDQLDITISSPVYNASPQEYNKFIGLRDYLEPEKNIKEFLMTVKQTVVEGYKNQYYPIDNIIRELGRVDSGLFSRYGLMQDDIHDKTYVKQLLKERENDIYLGVAKDGERLSFDVHYNAGQYKEVTIARLVGHYRYLLAQILENTGIKIRDIRLTTEEEKKKILENFAGNTDNAARNDPTLTPPRQTIHQLFEDRAEAFTDGTAVIYEDSRLTYGELNRRAGRLAGILIKNGVKPNSIVGIMVERSIEMITGIMGILKAGAAYLPIDPEYPAERIGYMISDCNVDVLLTQSDTAGKADKIAAKPKQINLEDQTHFTQEPGEPGKTCPPANPASAAYIIYTSGSTGKPKGVIIEHQAIVNMLYWRKTYHRFDENDAVLQLQSFSFDASVEEIFPPLISGSKLVLIDRHRRFNLEYLHKRLVQNKITHISTVPQLYRTLLQEVQGERRSLKSVTIGGDSYTTELVKMHYEQFPHVGLYNVYGPTENSVGTTVYKFDRQNHTVLIGKPINSKIKCIVLDKMKRPTPVGLPGELYASGTGLARGYINNPELTNEKFLKNPYNTDARMYKTGDQVRWTADGNLEFLGRIDRQLKIRGFRIEAGEIESHLEKHDSIKEAVVVARGSNINDRYLCAYVVPAELQPGDRPVSQDVQEIMDFLANSLPAHMIPAYIVPLEKIPLNPNGKIDKKKLPEPEESTGRGYTAPRNNIEERLTAIWSALLKKDKVKIGINDNFFQLGGHSLMATILIARIHKEFSIKMTLTDLFKAPHIRGTAKYLNEAVKMKHTDVEPVEKKEFYRLSRAQQRLYILQQVHPHSTGYNMPLTIILEGKLDKERLLQTFRDLIKRHESLRTYFVTIDEVPAQRILDKVDFEIQYFEGSGAKEKVYGEAESEDELNDIAWNFIKPFELSRAPLLRVGLIKKEEDTHILVVDIHHIVTDGVSMSILTNDFVNAYTQSPQPPLKLQYKDFSEWQNREKEQDALKKQEEYWIRKYQGEIPQLNLPMDNEATKETKNEDDYEGNFEGSYIRLPLPVEVVQKINAITKGTQTTRYIFLLAVFNILLSKYSAQNDIIIGSPITGRRHIDFQGIIGMFVNMLALRNRPEGQKRFVQFLEEVKQTVQEAYDNQDYQFDELVGKIVKTRNTAENPLFNTVMAMQNVGVIDEEAIEPESEKQQEKPIDRFHLKITPYKSENTISRFYLTQFVSEVKEEIYLTYRYSVKLFKRATIEKMAGHYNEIVEQVTKDVNIKLEEIELSVDLAAAQNIGDTDDVGFDF